MSEYIIILTTVPEKKEGQKIAQILVEERLAACVTQSSVSDSIYRWKGVPTDDKEYMLFIKTKRDLFARVEKRISEVHPYDIPEIIAIPIVAGSKSYLSWVEENTKKP